MSYMIFSAGLSWLAFAPTTIDLLEAMPPTCELLLAGANRLERWQAV